MEERLINNASFSKICKMLQKKESVWNDVKPILQATILVIPALVNKDIVTAMALREALDRGLVWLDAGEKIGSAFSSIKNFVTKQDEDFVTRAENAQIANVLLVFSAFFDTVKIFLPDREGKIHLGEVQYCLTEKSLKAYREKLQKKEKEGIEADGKRIADWNLVLPNPLEDLDKYEARLKEFYTVLCASFRNYLDGLSCTEDLQEHFRGELNRRLEMIPGAAVGSYKEQYYALAAVCSDFFVWTNQQEHQQQRELVDKGFKSLSVQLQSLPERFNNHVANEALTSLDDWYTSWINEPIIPVRELPPQDKEMRMPTREKCFVPQAYEWLIYRQPISIEATHNWKQGGQIGQDILNVLRSPELGSMPLLILGDPGAGKTTLCHMLAGKILRYEYHVIVVHLRDINAEVAISKQIDEAIEKTLDDSDCKWGNIAKATLPKPILLIFDGYDELLQIKGKRYSNYLTNIVDFQENQWRTRKVVIRSIVTSRIVLIDKVDIPIGTVVFRLKPFDKPRIDAWCEEWNHENEVYFNERGLEKFEVEEGSKAWELAGEPLLLLMLALFDTKENALRKHQNLQATELYGSLIRDFVEREKKKNPKFEENVEQDDREAVFEDEIEHISIAALGMFNRNVLHITSSQLEKDLEFLAHVGVVNELKDSEKLLGSFFFIHKSTTRSADVQEKEKLRAYTFLHNTFGEFLTAHYIVIQLYNLLVEWRWRGCDRNRNKHFSMKERREWYSCLSYAPLFRRPVVGQMIREWAPQYFNSKGFEMNGAERCIRELLDREIPRILRGDVISEIEEVSGRFQIDDKLTDADLMEHLAIYSNNLLSVAALLTEGVLFKKAQEETTPREWEKFLHLWRYAFDENDIAAFAGRFTLNRVNTGSTMVALEKPMDLKSVNDRVSKIYSTYRNLQDEPARSILGALFGMESNEICKSLSEQKIRAESKSVLLSVVLDSGTRRPIGKRLPRVGSNILRSYPNTCISEGDYNSLYAYFLVLTDVAAYSEEHAKNVALLLDFDLIMDVCAHCRRHHPVIVAPIFELLSKLLPVIRKRDLNRVLERAEFGYEEESYLDDRTVFIETDFLQKCVSFCNRGPWLEACWRLLRTAARGTYRGISSLSHTTLEKMCLLNAEAYRLDDEFPLNFVKDLMYEMVEDSSGINLLSVLMSIEFLEKYSARTYEKERQIILKQVQRYCQRQSDIPDRYLMHLADFLLQEYVQTDMQMWLDASKILLNRVEYRIHDDGEFNCDDLLLEKMLMINIGAYKKDKAFPLDFAIRHSLTIAERVQSGYARSRSRYINYSYTDLLVLLETLDVIRENECSKHQYLEVIRNCAVMLLHIMDRERVSLFIVWVNKPKAVLALCRTVQEFPSDIHEYIANGLNDLVRRSGDSLPLEMYRVLRTVAEEINDPGLRSALMETL